MSDIFYQYKILENPIELIVKPMNSEIEFLGNILNFYEDEKNEPAEYKVVENSEKILMAISKGSKDNDPILNYVFIIKDKTLAFNTILRSIKNSYNEIYTNDSILKCIGNEWLNLIYYWFNFEKLAWLKC